MISQLYQLSKRYQWAVANSGLIQDVYILKQPPSYGKRGRALRKIIALMRFNFAVLIVMRTIALADVSRWWWKAGPDCKTEAGECRIFVGFGAGPEEKMWRKFSEENKGSVFRLDQTQPASFGKLHRPHLISLWKETWIRSGQTFDFLQKESVEPVVSCLLDFVTFATMRMGQYVFFLRWWTEMLDRGVQKVAFISADTPAFACLDSGFRKVEFRQHGLLRKSILMPPFPVMKLLTEDEKNYYADLMPDSRIEVVGSHHVVFRHRKVILIASCYETPSFYKQNYLQTLNETIVWASQRGFRIVVRRHPCENDDFWQTHFPDIIIDDGDDSFEDAMLRLRPMIMLTWFSTTLIDALRCNVVPVSISAIDNRHVQDQIITLSEHCLMWPEQKPVLDSLAVGELSVDEVVRKLSRSKGMAHES